MDQDQLLGRLLAVFPGQVFLAGRYADGNLRLGDDGVEWLVHAIGHTHRARILVDRLPDGSPHVVLD